MPKKSKTLCVDDLRHAEYYGMQDTFDELYQKSQNGEVFENLMDLIVDLCQYFEHKKLKGYADFFNSSSSFCCGVI